MVKCAFCDTDKQVKPCPRCGTLACANDLLLPHPVQLELPFDGAKAPEYEVCIGCRAGMLGISDDQLFAEKELPPDGNGKRQRGVMYEPTPLASQRIAELVEGLESMNVLQLNALAERFDRQAKKAKQIGIFHETRALVVRAELRQRVNTLYKRRAAVVQAREATRKEKAKRVGRSEELKLMKLASKLAKSGMSLEQLEYLIRRGREKKEELSA